MRRREPPRVVGPYKEQNRWRIVTVENKVRKSYFVESEVEALNLKRRLEREVTKPASRTVGEIMKEFIQDRISTGRTLPMTAESYRQRLSVLLAAYLDRDIADVTPKRAAVIYTNFTQHTFRGHVIAVATHRVALTTARIMWCWAIQRGYVSANPFAQVQPVGKINVGKKQLRINEARSFTDAAVRLFVERNDRLALGALVALLLGLRASEVLKRTARDLDDGGRVLWIDSGKTQNARRHLKVPEALRPHLVSLSASCASDEYMFGTSPDGNPRRNNSFHLAVRRVCDAAKVPRVCPHSLRGLYATLAVESGAVADMVASSLGHGSFAITQRHYAQESAVRGAQTGRVSALLSQPTDEEGKPERDAAELLRSLPSETLEKLLAMAAANRGPKGQS